MASKFKHLPDISTIQPERLIKYRVSEDRFSAEVLLPGLAYTDFDQKIGGKLSLWSVAKLFESIRWQAMKHGFMYYPKLRENHKKTLFVAGQSFEISEKMHDIRYSDDFGLNKPLLGYVYTTSVGRTSFSLVVELFDYKSQVKLGTCVSTSVYVNSITRKPHPLPEYCLENISEHLKVVHHTSLDKPQLPKVPYSSFKYEVKALHSDSDMNQHITQAMYSKWCSDAAAMGARLGNFVHFKKHVELYPLKSTLVHFIGESLVNDILTVNVWESSIDKKVLHFAVTNAGKIVFIMDMKFYDGERIRVTPHLEAKL